MKIKEAVDRIREYLNSDVTANEKAEELKALFGSDLDEMIALLED